MNSFCDFDTFVEICYGIIGQYKKIALMGLEFPELFDRAEFLALYIKSKNTEFITRILKDYYRTYIHEFDKRDMKLKVIDIIEQSSLIDLANNVLPEIKEILLKENLENFLGTRYVINKFTLKTFPDLTNSGEDLNLNRLGPFMPINPLKAHKANPTYNIPREFKRQKRHFSLSKTRIYKGYCTLNTTWLH